MKAIVVTGTPGTGKTFVAEYIAKRLGFQRVDINRWKKELSIGFDRKRNTTILDIKKLNAKLIKEIRGSRRPLVIDSHVAHELPPRYTLLCIVTHCSLKELKRRLTQRKYSTAKIRENLDAEIFDVCRTEAVENGHSVIEIDTGKPGWQQKVLHVAKLHLNKESSSSGV